MNTRKIGTYIVLTLFSLSALAAGIPKLLALDFMLENMSRLGYSTLFTQGLGVLWILAAIGVWIPKYRSWAALGTIPIIAGAIAAHRTAGDPWTMAVGAVAPALLLAALILYLDGFYSRVVQE